MAAVASSARPVAPDLGPFRLIESFNEIKDEVIDFFGKVLIPENSPLRENPIWMTALKVFLRLALSNSAILATKETWVPPDKVPRHITLTTAQIGGILSHYRSNNPLRCSV